MSRSLYARLARQFRGEPSDAERRAFLQAALAAAAGSMLSACSSGRSRGKRASADQRVIVIGAGLAGLACAYELASAGFDVRVLEARKRLGGRVLSVHDLVPGAHVEGGGERIGANHPVWLAYAERFGLELRSTSGSATDEPVLVLDGRKLPHEERRRVFEELEGALASLSRVAARFEPDAPWLSPRASEYDLATAARWIEEREISGDAKRCLTAQWSAQTGVPTTRQSLLAWLARIHAGGLERFWTDSELYHCAGGNARLAERLAVEIGAERVELGRPTILIRQRERSVLVITADDKAYEADHVVLTVAPTVWSRIRMEPELPRSLRGQVGNTFKYIAALGARPWAEGSAGPRAISDGELELVWEANAGERSGEGAALVAQSGGPAADACRAREGEELDRAYREQFEVLVRGSGAAITGGRVFDWPRDPWTRCAASFPAPGEVTRLGPQWRRAVGRLRFAGEHTSSKFPGTMEGALDSGVALAGEIARGERTPMRAV